ncbi:MAG: hypothetical protein ACREAD_04200 [Nitrosopumilaceae archaeon]
MGIQTQTINGTITQIINFNDPTTTLYTELGVVATLLTVVVLLVQILRQAKVDSARFTIDYIDRVLEKNKEVVDIIYNRQENNSIKFESDKSVRVLLNQLEDIMQFAEDKVILKEHLLNTLKILLYAIKKDSEVQRIISDAQKKNNTAYVLLEKFLKRQID